MSNPIPPGAKRPKHRPRESRHSPRILKAKLKHMEALRLRLQGFGVVAIAERLGYASHSTVSLAIDNALKQTAGNDVEALRELEVQRCDYLLERLNRQIELGDPVAVNGALAISKRRAALLGLDAPKAAPVGPDGQVQPVISVSVVYETVRRDSAAAPASGADTGPA